MNAAALEKRCAEVAKRINAGESQEDLAREYRVNRVTIWRWNNRGQDALLPAPEDREAWRQEFSTVLARNIAEADQEGDRKSLVALVDRHAKLLGLDHSDKVNEALVRVEAAKLDLLAQALATALQDAGVDEGTRAAIGEALDTRLAELEVAK